MSKRLKIYTSVLTIAVLLFNGCGVKADNQTEPAADSTGSTASVSETGDTSSSQVVVDTEFTARDLEVGYEESTATNITLNGSSIEVSGDGAAAEDGVLTISQEGTYVISGTLNDGQILVDAGDSDKVHIIFNGITISCSQNAPVYIKNADKVFITLKEGTKNTLTDGAEYVQTDDNNVDGAIFSKADLTINGEGALNVTGNYKHGIASKDDLVITGGILNITAVKDALNGKDCVKIKDGTLNLTASGDGIQSKNDDDATKGYVYIAGGDITVLESDEGIEGTVILIEDGTVNITAEDDGMNAASDSSSGTVDDATVNTESGNPTANKEANQGAKRPARKTTKTTDTTEITTDTTEDTADTSDENTAPADGDFGGGFGGGDFGGGDFGGGGGAFEEDTNCYISIKGGLITVNAGGDGIDSNGSLYVSGGSTYVSGPTARDNGALDYAGAAEITGGTFIAAGSSGMAQAFSDTSTQYSLLYNFTTAIKAGTEIKLTDEGGNVIASYTPDKEYQSVVISAPDLTKGNTYTLTCGDQTADITLTSVVTSNGQQGGGPGGPGGPGR